MVIDKEIIDNFKQETNELLEGLNNILEQLEDLEDSGSQEFPEELLESFCQQIDRIMGTASTISMMEPDHPAMGTISKLTELCKKMGYNAIAAKQTNVVNLFTAFWADVTEILQKLVDNFENEQRLKKIVTEESVFLKKRLEWLHARIPKLIYDKDKAAAQTDKAGSGGQKLNDFIKSLLK